MNRLIVDRKLHWDALRAQGADLLLFSALIVVGLSYAIGYRLDWSEENGRPEEDVEIAAIPAPAAVAASARPSAPEAAASAPLVATMSAPPVPEMRPDPHDAAWDKMVSQLDGMAAHYSGRVSVYLKDLRSGRTWTHNP